MIYPPTKLYLLFLFGFLTLSDVSAEEEGLLLLTLFKTKKGEKQKENKIKQMQKQDLKAARKISKEWKGNFHSANWPL